MIGHRKDQSVTYMEGLVMADIKLGALDLDGTLLTTDKKLTDHQGSPQSCAWSWHQGRSDNRSSSKAMDFFLHELDWWSGGQYTITFVVIWYRKTQEILDKTVFSVDDASTLVRETEKLGLPLDAISRRMFSVQSDQEVSMLGFSLALTFIACRFESLPSQMTYNKCVTAFA